MLYMSYATHNDHANGAAGAASLTIKQKGKNIKYLKFKVYSALNMK